MSEFTSPPDQPAAELAPLVGAVRSIRTELLEIDGYSDLVDSKVYDRYRRLKQRLGKTALHPDLLVEITTTNIAAKNRFKELFETEEKKIVEKTNRIYEIERYLSQHPELADGELQQHLADFRHYRIRYESGRSRENVKRDDIAEMTRAMQSVLNRFDPGAHSPNGAATEQAGPRPFTAPPDRAPRASISTAGADVGKTVPGHDAEGHGEPGETSISTLLPPDPLLNEVVHSIVFALEMVIWDQLPAQVIEAPEISNFDLETWEAESYRKLVEEDVEKGTADWELFRFFLSSAALRVKMDRESAEINRLEVANDSDQLFTVLEQAAQSLERARDTDHRFQWFIDDMLFRGHTKKLEQVYKSRFRFLHAYSGLWLDHQRCGGLTPI